MVYFHFPQSNRIAQLIDDMFNCKPKFLWSKFHGYGVFRNSQNNKWFAVILDINKEKLRLNNESVEILNVKVDTSSMDSLLNISGIFKGYHMNKKHWISIILDDIF